jgi:hypothetical protein
MMKPQNWKRKSPPGNSLAPVIPNSCNGTARFKKYNQLLEYQHLLLLKDIWCSKLKIYINMLLIFQHQCTLTSAAARDSYFLALVSNTLSSITTALM